MFSDGVFAVLITVLVLELRPPELPTFKALLSLWPTWLSYAVSYLFIAIVWANHHHLMRYATETTPRLMWFNFAHLFSVSLLPLSTAWMAVSKLAPQPVAFLCRGVLPCKRDLHSFDLGAYRARSGQRRLAEGAQDHALSVDHHSLYFRGGCDCCAEISAGWTWNVLLLPDRLPKAGSAGSRDITRLYSCHLFALRVSARLQGKDKGLTRINTIRISDPVSVCPVNKRVPRAVAIGDTADAPQAVAAGYDCGRSLRLSSGGR